MKKQKNETCGVYVAFFPGGEFWVFGVFVGDLSFGEFQGFRC